MAAGTLRVEQIRDLALNLVASERARQIEELGYDHDHDDQHDTEDLAIAAAVYLIPAWLNPDICLFDIGTQGLRVAPLLEALAEHTFDVSRGDPSLYGIKPSYPELSARIGVLMKGVALGLAEMERLMRISNGLQDPDEESDG